MAWYSAALTNPQLVKLREDGSNEPEWAADQVICLTQTTTIFAARVNGAKTGTFAEIDFDTVTTGAYTDIEVDQRILVSATNDVRAAYFDGYVRLAPTSSKIYINETSIDIANDDYVFVVYDFPLTDRLARPVSLNAATWYKSYNKVFERMAPVPKGVKPVYVGNIDSGTSKLRVVLNAANCYVADNDAVSISSYAWTFKSGTATVVSGGLTQSAVTVDVTEGHQWVKLLLTDSAGIQWIYRFEIHACGSNYTPIAAVQGVQISAEVESGYRCTLTAFDNVSTVLDKTRMVVWRPYEQHNGTEGELIDDENIDFIGYIVREQNRTSTDLTYTLDSDVTFEVIGIADRLAQIAAQSLAIRNSASPTVWNEIENLYPWRAIVHYLQRHTTVLNLYPLDFDSNIKNSSYLFPVIPVKEPNALSVVKELAQQINGSFEFAPDGRMQVVRIGHYLDSSARSSVLNVADLDTRDYVQEMQLALEQVEMTGQVVADGAYYDSGTGLVTALVSVGPGHAQDTGSETGTLNNQILAATSDKVAAQAELDLRVETARAILNDEGNELILTVPDPYFAIFIPSYGHTYTWTFTTSDNIRGISYTTSTKWFCTAVSYTHNNGNPDGTEAGTRSVQVTFKRLLPIPSSGEAPPAVSPGDIAPALPDLPGLPAFDFELPEMVFPLEGLDYAQIKPEMLQPPKDKVAKVDGNVHLFKSTDGTKALLGMNVIVEKTPRLRDVTPDDLGSYIIRAVLFDPFNKADSIGNKYAYILASDNVNSKVWRTSNVFALPKPVWLASAESDGEYNVLRGTLTEGSLMKYGSDTGSENANVTFDSGGSTYDTLVGTVGAYGNPGNGIKQDLDVDTAYRCIISLDMAGGAGDINISYDWTANHPGFGSGAISPQGGAYLAGVLVTTFGTADQFTAHGVWTNLSYTVTVTGAFDEIRIGHASANARGSAVGAYAYMDNVVVAYNANAQTSLSTDYGATWAAPDTVGTQISVGGFDVQKAGTRQLGGADNQVKVATTLGGAYANAGGGGFSNDPSCIIIPYYRRGSTTVKNTDVADPDYIVGLNGGTNTLYWVDGLTDTQNNITPVSSATVPTPNSITTQYGTHIAAIVNDGGTYKLYTSVNNGGSWTFRQNLSSDAKMIRTRRGDTRAKNGGDKGQLWIANGTQHIYSFDWGVTRGTRTLPISCDQFDVLG